MKHTNKIKLFISIACITFALLFACENPWMAEVLQEKTITFESNGGSPVPPQTLFAGERVKRPYDPVKQGYIFEGWYKDNETFEDPYDFNSIPIENMTLYARWREATPDDLLIKSVNVKITGPATGEQQNTGATADGTGYSTLVSWSPEDTIFKGKTVYTASVTLFAIEDYQFASSITAKINGYNASISNQSQTSITLSYTFAETSEKAVKLIEISTPPRLQYTYGEKLDLTGLIVKITYDDSSQDVEVGFSDFQSKLIFTDPINDTLLSVSEHNGKPVTVSLGKHNAYTNSLTVNKATPTATDFTVSGIGTFIYDGKAKTVTVNVRENIAGMGSVTVYYIKETSATTGSTSSPNAPYDVGTYNVTFNVSEGANYNQASNLSAGTLIINNPTFNSVSDLSSYLNTLTPDNDIPYTISLNVSSSNDLKTLGPTLSNPNNNNKNVILDLSGSNIESIPNSAFYNCTGLTGIIIPEDVTTIGSNAFQNCTNLIGINIPDIVTSIGDYAFSNCTGLTSVTLPTNSSFQEIKSFAFYGCTGLTIIFIPNNVTTIGRESFSDCTNITTVTIGNGVTSIGSSAFSGCTKLASITIPSSVTKIDYGAFKCTNLTSVKFECNITTDANFGGTGNTPFYGDLKTKYLTGGIGTYTTTAPVSDPASVWTKQAFTSTDDLQAYLSSQPINSPTNPYTVKFNFTFPTTLDSSIESVITYNEKYVNLELTGNTLTAIGNGAFDSCRELTGITIPGSVSIINGWAFENCDNLTEITIPGSVLTIGTAAFYSCVNLTNVTIENGVTNIGESAFSSCEKLTTITIPDSVLTIGAWAFLSCENLTSVIFRGTILETDFSSDAFDYSLRDAFYAEDSTNGTPGTYEKDTNGYWVKKN